MTNSSTSTQGTVTIQGNNCVGGSPVISQGFVRELNYFCYGGQTCYPENCYCCLPQDVPSCDPARVSLDTLNLPSAVDGHAQHPVPESKADVLRDATGQQVGGSKPYVSPNPSTGVFRVRGDKPYAISVYDLSGLLRWQLPAQQAAADIDLSALPAGIYLLQLQHAQEHHWYKVLLIR